MHLTHLDPINERMLAQLLATVQSSALRSQELWGKTAGPSTNPEGSALQRWSNQQLQLGSTLTGGTPVTASSLYFACEKNWRTLESTRSAHVLSMVSHNLVETLFASLCHDFTMPKLSSTVYRCPMCGTKGTVQSEDGE